MNKKGDDNNPQTQKALTSFLQDNKNEKYFLAYATKMGQMFQGRAEEVLQAGVSQQAHL